MKGAILSLVLIAVMVVGVPSAAQSTQTIKFHGVFYGQDLGSQEGLVTQVGVGNFTDLGNFTFISVGAYTQPKHPTCTDDAAFERTFKAHSGDIVRFGVNGETCPTGEIDFYLFTGNYTVDGGTGKYSGAMGSGSVETLINIFTASFQGRMEGTLILQDSQATPEIAGLAEVFVFGSIVAVAATFVLYRRMRPSGVAFFPFNKPKLLQALDSASHRV
ncbi:MAG TPA: hypothetical protein VGR53_01605 [Nitrososphaerales archaeon]|nr:hypothetical protein [Nitrososphaerales archaeon]